MANENRLTKRDKVVYSAIAGFIKENKYPPSVRELGELTDRTSTATISATLRSLERKGYITTKKGANRTIVIVKDLEGNPIADAVEVVHGRWETANDGTHFCSCCGCDAPYTWDDVDRSFVNSADDVPDRPSNYCPNCGAKMDGDWNG